MMTEDRFSKIKSWFSDEFHEDFLNSAGGGVIRYAYKNGNTGQGTVIIVPGRTEFVEKYIELCWDLRERGFSICVYDHLGQGKSDRLLKDRQKGHISDFSIYVLDLQQIIESIVLPAQNGPVIVLAHSMGATICSLLNHFCPQSISGLIMVSPMLQINARVALPPFLVELICNTVCRTGGGEDYVWGGGPYNPDPLFTNNPLTTDEARFRRNNELVRQNMDLALGSPTYGWLQQAYRAMRQTRRKSYIEGCPTIIFGSRDERVVQYRDMEIYCSRASGCSLVSYENCQHELLMERDEIRDDLLAEISQFLTSFAEPG